MKFKWKLEKKKKLKKKNKSSQFIQKVIQNTKLKQIYFPIKNWNKTVIYNTISFSFKNNIQQFGFWDWISTATITHFILKNQTNTYGNPSKKKIPTNSIWIFWGEKNKTFSNKKKKLKLILKIKKFH